MARITPQSWRRLECVFTNAGFVYARQTSSHIIYEKPGVARPLVIPEYDEIGQDIIIKLIRTAGITRAEYFRLLNKC